MLWKLYNKKLNYFIESDWDFDKKRKYRQTTGIVFYSCLISLSCLILAIYFELLYVSILEFINVIVCIYEFKLLKEKKLKFAQSLAIYYFEVQIFILAILFSTHFSESFVWSYALLLTVIYPAIAAIFDLSITKHFSIIIIQLISFQALYHILPEIFFLNVNLLEQNNLLLIKAVSFSYLILFNAIVIYLIYNEQLIAKKRSLRYSNRLKAQNKKIKELNKSKDKLFSIISHDLRSPFNSIIGFSGLLMNSKGLNSKQLKYSEIINKSSKDTLSLIDNLLYWSKSQLNSIQPNFKYHRISNIINNVVSNLQSTALQKNISVLNSVDNELSAFIDSTLIQITIRNLISNSIKFSNNDGVIIVNATKLSNNFIKVSVKDKGVGIDSNEIYNLFNLNFTQIGTNNEIGSGLGLHLCKEFVTMHKGEIWVESEKEKGTVVSFTIPLYNTKN